MNEKQLDETGTKQSRQTLSQRDRHNEKKKTLFLAELAMSANITLSAKVAGIPQSTIYDWRQHDLGFREQWMTALSTGYELLEMVVLQRALGGVEKKVFHAGKHVDTVVEYDNGLALKLLIAHKEMVAMTRAAQQKSSGGATAIRDELDKKLDQMRERLAARRAQENEQSAANVEAKYARSPVND